MMDDVTILVSAAGRPAPRPQLATRIPLVSRAQGDVLPVSVARLLATSEDGQRVIVAAFQSSV